MFIVTGGFHFKLGIWDYLPNAWQSDRFEITWSASNTYFMSEKGTIFTLPVESTTSIWVFAGKQLII